MNDVFGSTVNDTYIEGLVDAQDDDEFQRKLDAVMESWQGNPVSSATKLDSFINRFNVNKSSAIRNYMLQPIQEECGLGYPLHSLQMQARVSMLFLTLSGLVQQPLMKQFLPSAQYYTYLLMLRMQHHK